MTNPASLGHGIGLRMPHLEAFLSQRPRVQWLEVISELAMPPAGSFLQSLLELRRDYPVVLHGVCMAVGSEEPVPTSYLAKLGELIELVEPSWVSDHLCWGRRGGAYSHELMPLPFNEEALAHVTTQVRRVQDTLRRQLAIENVSALSRVAGSEMTEWEFLAELSRRADCKLLVDVNNVYVNARNHGFDPRQYLEHLPPERVAQLHLAGHHDAGRFVFDTHDRPVRDEVWDLYRLAVRRFGATPTLIEWDESLPPLERVIAESETARAIEQQTLAAD